MNKESKLKNSLACGVPYGFNLKMTLSYEIYNNETYRNQQFA